jgi:hypothetical protein
MNESISWGKIAVLVVAIVGIGIMAFLWGRKSGTEIDSQPAASSSKKTETATIPKASSTSPVIDKTADWNIYTNKKYGYTFKYPRHYSLYDGETYKEDNIENANEVVLNIDGGIDGFHTVKVSKKDFLSVVNFHVSTTPSYFGKSDDPTRYKKSDIIFQGINAVQFDYGFMRGKKNEIDGYERTIIFSKDGYTYELMGSVEDFGQPDRFNGVDYWDFDDILDTFQFTN